MTPAAYLERVRSLLPAVRARAHTTEQLRRLPDETVKDFQELGLFRALQPQRYGGYELDPSVFYQAVMEVSSVCGSSGWVLGVVGVHNWQIALFPPQAQDDVWGDDSSMLIASSLAPTGHVERAPGGYRLHGRWSFSSGCDLCGWAVLAAMLPSSTPDAAPERLIFLVPRRDYTIEDNWQVMGLCGSGSKDVLVEEAFVPEYRMFSSLDAFHIRSPGLALHAAPLFRLPFSIIFAYGIAAPAIGVALGALDTVREQAKTRLWTRDQSRVAEDPFVQIRLAEASAAAEAARARMLLAFDDMIALTRAQQPIPLEHRARYRWEAAHAVSASAQAVDRLFEASGGRAVFLDNPIQRAFRDVHAMRAHAGNNPDKIAAIFARSEFGLPPKELVF